MDQADDVLGKLTYASQTLINPLGLAVLLVLGIAVLSAKKKNVVIPILILACFISSAQRIAVAGLDFSFMRIMIIFGWIRVLYRREHKGYVRHPADKLMIAWAVSKTVIHTIQRMEIGAFVYMVGQGFALVPMLVVVTVRVVRVVA